MKWQLNENRIPTRQEVRQLVKSLKERSDAAVVNGLRQPVIDWATVHTLIGSGIRSHELTQLILSDLRLGHGQAEIIVRHGKGDKFRIVAISEPLKKHLLAFITWRKGRGENVEGNAPLFLSERGSGFTTRAVRYLFKRAMLRAGLDAKRFGCHSLRHYHLSALYENTNDLKIIQSQAGHANINTSSIYLHQNLEKRRKAVENLF